MNTEIAGIKLKGPVFNAAGPRCTTLEQLKAIGESESSAIVTKSCTVEHRDGNPEPRYVDIDHGSINSMGLPNHGYKKYLEYFEGIKDYDKPKIVSISGMSLDDNIKMVEAFNDSDYDLIELNLSCPNIKGKPQVGYDFAQSEETLTRVMDIVDKPLGVKLPPYFDMVHFERMAEILNRHQVDFVTCINSIGNGLFIDPETESVVIKPKKGFGGIGGKYVHPTALANVRRFYQLLDGIDVIGVGGITTGVDVFKFLLCGARAVQLGTVFMQEGPSVFERINKEFEAYIDSKGYSSIEDFRGQLKDELQ